MDMTITEKIENSLFGRTEVHGEVKFEGSTPSNAQVAEAVAKNFNTEAGNVVMRQIYTKYSKMEALFECVVYNSLESRKKAERPTPQEKKKAAEAKKAQQEKKE